MKIFVKTLKGTHFEIQVNPDDKVVDVKNNIEALQGQSVYPAESQMLIHQGKILKDETTLEENKVSENSFIVIMLNKAKGSSSGASTTVKAPSNQPPPANTAPANPSTPVSASPQLPASTLSPVPASAPAPEAPAAPSPAVTVTAETDVYGQAASNLVAGSNFEQTIQYILDMGGGTWNRETVAHALRAAYNNPERAVEYLYSGIPENAAVPPVAEIPTEVQTVTPPSQVVQPPQPAVPQPAVPSGGPNANPLDLFPQGIPSMGPNAGAGNLDFLRNSPQFRYLQAMVQSNPQILQPMLQELGKQNPNVMRLIQQHQAEFLRLINEPAEGGEGWPEGEQGQLPAGMPQQITVTPEEAEAMGRLEAMGFDRALVLEVFVACNRNEELAANYLLDHMHEFEE